MAREVKQTETDKYLIQFMDFMQFTSLSSENGIFIEFQAFLGRNDCVTRLNVIFCEKNVVFRVKNEFWGTFPSLTAAQSPIKVKYSQELQMRPGQSQLQIRSDEPQIRRVAVEAVHADNQVNATGRERAELVADMKVRHLRCELREIGVNRSGITDLLAEFFSTLFELH